MAVDFDRIQHGKTGIVPGKCKPQIGAPQKTRFGPLIHQGATSVEEPRALFRCANAATGKLEVKRTKRVQIVAGDQNLNRQPTVNARGHDTARAQHTEPCKPTLCQSCVEGIKDAGKGQGADRAEFIEAEMPGDRRDGGNLRPCAFQPRSSGRYVSACAAASCATALATSVSISACTTVSACAPPENVGLNRS